MEVKDLLMLNVEEVLEMEAVQDIVDQEVLGLTNGELEEVEVVMEEMEGIANILVKISLLKVEKGLDFM